MRRGGGGGGGAVEGSGNKRMALYKVYETSGCHAAVDAEVAWDLQMKLLAALLHDQRASS